MGVHLGNSGDEQSSCCFLINCRARLLVLLFNRFLQPTSSSGRPITLPASAGWTPWSWLSDVPHYYLEASLPGIHRWVRSGQIGQFGLLKLSFYCLKVIDGDVEMERSSLENDIRMNDSDREKHFKEGSVFVIASCQTLSWVLLSKII